MPNPKQEGFLRDEFNRWLVREHPDAAIQWSDGSEPPDFWLDVSTRRYAVEASRILDERERCITASQERLVQEVERQACKRSTLSGRYLVTWNKDPLTIAGKGAKRRIVAELVNFIEQTKAVAVCEAVPIDIDAHVVCRIEKYAATGQKVYGILSASDTGIFEHEVRSEIAELIKRRVSAKLDRLKSTARPWILILYDLYGLADPGDWTLAIGKIPEVRAFHTVYVVEDESQGYALFSAPFE